MDAPPLSNSCIRHCTGKLWSVQSKHHSSLFVLSLHWWRTSNVVLSWLHYLPVKLTVKFISVFCYVRLCTNVHLCSISTVPLQTALFAANGTVLVESQWLLLTMILVFPATCAVCCCVSWRLFVYVLRLESPCHNRLWILHCLMLVFVTSLTLLRRGTIRWCS